MYEEEKKKYQQRWEFRDVRDRFNDSSSDDDCTSIKKKHKLLSDMFLETDEETGVNCPLPKSRLYQKLKKDKRVVIPSHSPIKKKKEKEKETKKKKMKEDNISLDGLKKFMESMLGELRVERETMFSRMREEMKRMDSNQKMTPKKVTTTTTITTASSSSLMNKEEIDHMMLMMMHQKPEENPQTNNGQSAFDSNGKIERLVKNPLLHSMMKKTVPIPEVLEAAAGGTGSDMTVGSEIVDLLTSPNLSAGFLSGGGGEQQLGSLCKMVSMNNNTSNVNGFSLYGSHHHQSSNMGRRGDGFAVPLHMGIMGNGNGAYKINNDNNVFGMRISGAAKRFSGGGGGGGNHNLVCSSSQPDDKDDRIW